MIHLSASGHLQIINFESDERYQRLCLGQLG
jgi:hypothetical protein